jgi:hypothetical protein
MKETKMCLQILFIDTRFKEKIDFEMQMNNVLVNNFKTINVNDFSYVATNFLLRPSNYYSKLDLRLINSKYEMRFLKQNN